MLGMLLNATFNGSIYLALFLYGARKLALAQARA
jgi:hypothetical protein